MRRLFALVVIVASLALAGCPKDKGKEPTGEPTTTPTSTSTSEPTSQP